MPLISTSYQFQNRHVIITNMVTQTMEIHVKPAVKYSRVSRIQCTITPSTSLYM
jgi:hypothetical protein